MIYKSLCDLRALCGFLDLSATHTKVILTCLAMSLETEIHADRNQMRYGGLKEKIFRLILEEENCSVWVDLLRAVATLAAWLYAKVATLRNFLFDHGILKIHRLNCPVISVGNLAMGGTGKTPMVVWLARLFS